MYLVIPAQAGIHSITPYFSILKIVKEYFVYILASHKFGTLYVGVTGNLENRMNIHQSSAIHGFTQKYQVYDLVYYEIHNNINEAIKREKQIKKWNRSWKINLIESINPDWKVLI